MASKKSVSALSIIKQFPFDEIQEIAKATKVDYKAKKLDGISLMVDGIYAMLCSSQVSQRIISLENGLPLLADIAPLKGYDCSGVSHSSISERLGKIKISFFEQSYQQLANTYKCLVPLDYMDEMSVTRIDSSMVAETANKLMRGFTTGINKDVPTDRRQLKYTMAYNGLSVTAARVFTKQTYSADNAPISKVVHESLRKRKDMSDFYVFDRGLKDVEDFKSIASHTSKENVYFVGRLAKSRKTECLEDLFDKDTIKSDQELEITDDYTSYLRAKGGSRWDMKEVFRIVKVHFIKPRPRNPKGTRRHARHYDDEMILITNNMEAEAMDIVNKYRKRWDIEVFFKFLKQDLSFSHFISTNINGIKVMLYLTLVTALLIKIYAINNKKGLRESKLAIINEMIKYQYRQICDLKKENKKKDRELEKLKEKLLALQNSSDH